MDNTSDIKQIDKQDMENVVEYSETVIMNGIIEKKDLLDRQIAHLESLLCKEDLEAINAIPLD
jgi:hypothetical protein